jgi:hypothetical protein
MTVIVWDGTNLATDKAGTDSHRKWATTKAWYHEGSILTGAGSLKLILEMREWYKRGAKTEDFPNEQRSSHFCQFVVVDEHGLKRYEQSPIPIEHGFNACAFGTGQDFAYGALAMGASAEQSVEATNKFSVNCGHGVEVFTITTESNNEKTIKATTNNRLL